jgi:hypothetical protein
MFCVIYEFNTFAEKEEVFKQLWHDITSQVRQHDGGLGSRLHKVVGKEDTWIAYAQWPSRELWLKQGPLTLSTQRAELVNKMRDICSSIKTLLELEVIDDLLEAYPKTK